MQRTVRYKNIVFGAKNDSRQLLARESASVCPAARGRSVSSIKGTPKRPSCKKSVMQWWPPNSTVLTDLPGNGNEPSAERDSDNGKLVQQANFRLTKVSRCSCQFDFRLITVQ